MVFDAIMVGSGVLWTLAYLLIIRRGFLEDTYGMPLVALCANLSWEFIFSFVHPHDLPQRAVNVVWFSFDLVILLQILLYGTGRDAEALAQLDERGCRLLQRAGTDEGALRRAVEEVERAEGSVGVL